MKTKADFSQYAFVITHEASRRQSYDDYDMGKITIDIRGWDDRKQTPCWRPDYESCVAKLTITAWYSEKFPGTYGDTMGLDLGSDLLTVDAAERYLPALKAIQKKLVAIEAKYGYPKTIGQRMAYVADALGMTNFCRPNEHYPSQWQSTGNVTDALAWCDYPIAQFHENHPKKQAA